MSPIFAKENGCDKLSEAKKSHWAHVARQTVPGVWLHHSTTYAFVRLRDPGSQMSNFKIQILNFLWNCSTNF